MTVLLAFGLSMDAFAVSITNGISYRINTFKNALASGLAFGVAQGAMPLLGYLLGNSFVHIVERVDHWLALILLVSIGGKMILDSIRQHRDPEAIVTREFSYRTLFLQAVATSIDALAVGVSLGALEVNLWFTISVITVITFICCFAGVFIGRKFGAGLKDKAEGAGGILLILIGIKIFLDHVWIF